MEAVALNTPVAASMCSNYIHGIQHSVSNKGLGRGWDDRAFQYMAFNSAAGALEQTIGAPHGATERVFLTVMLECARVFLAVELRGALRDLSGV